MADDVDVSKDMRKQCGYCNSKVTKKYVKCKKCGSVYHKSCATTKKNAQETDVPGVIVCCVENEVRETTENKSTKIAILEEEKAVLLEDNYLLRRLLKEMEENNILLEEKISTMEREIFINKRSDNKTYSQILQEHRNVDNPLVPKLANIPNILVKPKERQEANQIKLEVCKKINPADLKVGIKRLKETKDGTLFIKCDNLQDMEVLSKCIEEKLGREYVVVQEKLENPRFKIVGLNGEYSTTELEKQIRRQNSINQEEYLKVKHVKLIK